MSEKTDPNDWQITIGAVALFKRILREEDSNSSWTPEGLREWMHSSIRAGVERVTGIDLVCRTTKRPLQIWWCPALSAYLHVDTEEPDPFWPALSDGQCRVRAVCRMKMEPMEWLYSLREPAGPLPLQASEALMELYHRTKTRDIASWTMPATSEMVHRAKLRALEHAVSVCPEGQWVEAIAHFVGESETAMEYHGQTGDDSAYHAGLLHVAIPELGAKLAQMYEVACK